MLFAVQVAAEKRLSFAAMIAMILVKQSSTGHPCETSPGGIMIG
jgi:hypothetical protein